MCSSKHPAKLAMLAHLALLLLCCGVGNVSAVHDNIVDRHSLLDFKKGITSDPNGVLSNWNDSTHYCRWHHVICTQTRPWRVSGLNLTGQSLEGQITSSLGNLTFLQIIDLSYNSLLGPLPVLSNLQQLHTLFLNNNNLQGIIPDSLTNCSNLEKLDLSVNLLASTIPPKLGFLPNLVYINLETNQLEGSIPDEFGKFQKLQSLLLGHNSLTGDFPPAILNISASLIYLGLENNMIGNALPANMAFPILTQITLEKNRFTGPIPVSLGNSLMLEIIDLGHNNFSGQIPTSFGKLKKLSRLALGGNQLTARDSESWEFLRALRNCTSLIYLSLFKNQLEGAIPNSVGDLPISLQHLSFDDNSLAGEVPPSIGNLSALITLALGGNKLSGTIEGWIETFKRIQLLDLQSNSFSGQIPPSIGNLTQLTYLYLNANELEGLIPTRLGNLPLLELHLSYNNLNGYIPPNFGNLQGLTLLDLSHNSLQGDIPQLGGLELLGILNVSSNKLTGKIPDALGKCVSLVSMQIDHNFLTGNIPITFGNLSLLTTLNLSHNNLSGTIPLALNKLESLTNLDLSYNHLQGEIPRNGVFENATAVSLEDNWGLCGGPMDLQMPSCPTVSKKTQRRDRLIEVLIPIFGFMSLALLLYFLLVDKKMRRRTSDTSSSLGENFLKVSYTDLAQATANFSESNLAGRGCYGSVYRGKIKVPEVEVEVAVKVFDLEMHGAEKSFLKECEALRSVQHRNLLPIITACSTVDNTGNVFKALIYEFMPNGNLDTWLHQRGDVKSQKHLSLTQRLRIAINIADALDYIHHDCGRPTIHCDLKPSNILLDDDMNALLGDFGIASFYQDYCSTSTSSSLGMKGTIGYIAPEYGGGDRHASTSGDVYSFGIILLEMVIGKRPTDPMFRDGVSIVNYVDSNFPHDIFHIIDAHLAEEHKVDFAQANKASENAVHQCLVSWLQVALSCVHQIPSQRMNMKQIASKMHEIKTSYISQKEANQPASSLQNE